MYDNYQITKPVFSGHETFPLRYGWIKKVYDEILKKQEYQYNIKNTFNNSEMIAVFGVGKNMVASMRHWAHYTGMLNAKDNSITNQAKAIFDNTDGFDPWMEHPNTLWLIHWNLVTNENLVTYYWLFNYYNGGSFDRQYLNYEINELCTAKKWRHPSEITLKRDIECFIRMYASKVFTDSYTEDNIESPLTELNLIRSINKHRFFLNYGEKPNLKKGIFLWCLCQFWKKHFSTETHLSFEAILYDPCSPGRIFLLDENALLGYIHQLSQIDAKEFLWTETAGVRQIILQNGMTLDKIEKRAWSIMEEEYKKL